MTTRSKASKQPQEPALPPNLKVSRAEAAQQIQSHLNKGREIRERDINTEEDLEKAEADRSKWTDYSVTLLTYIFDNTSKAEEYRRKTTPIAIGGRLPLVEEKKFFKSFMDHRITLLESVLESLELIPELTKVATSSVISDRKSSFSRNIFIVHGHDEAAKALVARFIQQLDLNPIILSEQPNAGKTVIEKFETYADVGFAVVLLTPDDLGTSKDKPQDLRPRARQNVILELGYFVAKLGRSKVCALHKGGIEIPSDYHGVLYVSMDSQDWQILLAKEIKQVIDIDMNRVFL